MFVANGALVIKQRAGGSLVGEHLGQVGLGAIRVVEQQSLRFPTDGGLTVAQAEHGRVFPGANLQQIGIVDEAVGHALEFGCNGLPGAIGRLVAVWRSAEAPASFATAEHYIVDERCKGVCGEGGL
jgi:hypothetical protein